MSDQKGGCSNSEDEEIIADICASIVTGKAIARSKDLLDDFYSSKTAAYLELRRALSAYGVERVYEEVKVTLSVLKEIVENFNSDANALRTVVNPRSTNPIKSAFFALFMALHNLLIVEEKSPDDFTKIMDSLLNLQKSMKTTAKYSKTEDREKNIAITKGLIQRYFVQKDPPMLRHGAGLALDLENSLRRSRVETSRYECKQGLVNLSPTREVDKKLPQKILETICGIANVGPDGDGFLFIGVADTKIDAERICHLDGMQYVEVGSRYVVGIEREFHILKCNADAYLSRILQFIKNSELSSPLKEQLLSQVDYVEYKGLSVIRIRIPRQTEISFLGNHAFIRENSSTVEAAGKKLLAINAIFS